jgi:hypothetical protein
MPTHEQFLAKLEALGVDAVKERIAKVGREYLEAALANAASVARASAKA